MKPPLNGHTVDNSLSFFFSFSLFDYDLHLVMRPDVARLKSCILSTSRLDYGIFIQCLCSLFNFIIFVPLFFGRRKLCRRRFRNVLAKLAKFIRRACSLNRTGCWYRGSSVKFVRPSVINAYFFSLRYSRMVG